MKKEKKNTNTGLITLFVCGTLTFILIIACIFFPEEFFGLFMK